MQLMAYKKKKKIIESLILFKLNSSIFSHQRSSLSSVTSKENRCDEKKILCLAESNLEELFSYTTEAKLESVYNQLESPPPSPSYYPSLLLTIFPPGNFTSLLFLPRPLYVKNKMVVTKTRDTLNRLSSVFTSNKIDESESLNRK